MISWWRPVCQRKKCDSGSGKQRASTSTASEETDLRRSAARMSPLQGQALAPPPTSWRHLSVSSGSLFSKPKVTSSTRGGLFTQCLAVGSSAEPFAARPSSNQLPGSSRRGGHGGGDGGRAGRLGWGGGGSLSGSGQLAAGGHSASTSEGIQPLVPNRVCTLANPPRSSKTSTGSPRPSRGSGNSGDSTSGRARRWASASSVLWNPLGPSYPLQQPLCGCSVSTNSTASLCSQPCANGVSRLRMKSQPSSLVPADPLCSTRSGSPALTAMWPAPPPVTACRLLTRAEGQLLGPGTVTSFTWLRGSQPEGRWPA
mmetsp:Transcript_99967/g.312392  ORF Transcript_99967/g.312392 Transcript_99967/m.312392 type:complete len:313 (-) Transcript_99967:150-1088(-)